jgi:hypothetical protein
MQEQEHYPSQHEESSSAASSCFDAVTRLLRIKSNQIASEREE